jgi:hypothetical protein
MGIVGKIVDTAAKKILIDSAGGAALSVAAGTADAISKIQERMPGKGNHICTLRDSEDFLLLSVQEAKDELLACGFTNIGLISQKAFLKKSGQVLAITIDGRSSFTKKTRFKNDVRVVLAFNGT